MKAVISYRRFLKAGLVFLEILAIIACLMAGAAGLAFWRLSRGPVDIGFARPFVEDALSDSKRGKSMTVERLMLQWPRINRPLQLYMGKVSILEHDMPVLKINSLSISLSGPYLFIGRIVPVSLIFREPALYLLRTSDNKISLRFQEESDSAREQAQAAETAPAPEAIAPDEDSRVVIDEIVRALTTTEEERGSRIAPLRHLRAVLVENARALVEDHVAGTTWRMRELDLSFLRDDDELMIEATAVVPGKEGDVASGIEITGVHQIGRGMTANLTLKDFDPAIITGKISGLKGIMIEGVRITGQVNILLDAELKPQKADMDFAATSGTFNYDNMYETPVAIEEMKIKASYDSAAGTISLSDVTVAARDLEMHVSGEGTVSKESVSMPIEVKIPVVTQKQIAGLWPSSLRETQAESWLIHRMSGGSVKNAEFRLDLSAAKGEAGWSVDAGNVHATFDIEDMDIDYNKPLRKAEKVSGKGAFDDHILNVQISKGQIADLAITDGTVRIDHIGHDDQISNADIKVRINGPLSTLFQYIESEPIAIKGEDIGLKADKIEGTADLEAHITFPAVHDLPKEDVNVDVSGTVNNILLPDVVEKLDLTGGPYDLKVADGLVTMKGKGQLEGRPIDLQWEQFISTAGKPYSSKIMASLAADNELRTAIGVGLPEWVDGAPQVEILYTEFNNGKAEVDVKADVTNAKMMVAPFDYTKPAGVKASVTCKALLKNKKLEEIKDLEARGEGISLEKSQFTFTNSGSEPLLQTGRIPRLGLGETNAKITLDRMAGNILKIAVEGPSLDAQPFLKRKDQQQNNADNTAVQATIMVDRMKTSALQDLNKVRTYLEIDQDGRARRVELDARAGGGTLTVRLLPDEKGVNTFHLESNDAGATLRAFDVFKEMRGGKIVADGKAPNAASQFIINGRAEITNFRVVGAPALARLISVLSLSGMSEVLSGEGMSFARLRTDFTWVIRKPGDIYMFKDGGTSGSSLGLSFEGTVNKETNQVDIKGEIVPASEVNNFLGNIPILGDLLSGGSGAIFAATYTITGPLEKQEVSVNPLSVLTPGIIRKMLFE